MFDMTGQASGRAGAPPHRWRQVGRRVIGAGAALIIGTAGVGLLAGQAYAAVSGQPGAAGAVRACRTWNRSESQFADVAARTVRTAAAQAAVAARADGRWSVLATDLRFLASRPETGNDATDVAQGAVDSNAVTASCQSLGLAPPVARLRPATAFANDEAAFDYFISKGLTNYEAAGIVGNLDQESGDNPTTIAPPPCPCGEGIAQWNIGARWNSTANDNMTWYASTLPGDPSATTLQPQLQFIWFELTASPKYGLSQLESSGNVTNATVDFQNLFEGCSVCEQSQRIAYAQDVLSAYGSSENVQAAFQANTNYAWSWAGVAGGGQTASYTLPDGMMPGTSPAVAAMPNGEVALAFQANNGDLWTLEANPGGSQTASFSTGQAMAEGTSPAITVDGNNIAVAYHDSSGTLATWTGAPGTKGTAAATPNGMATDTSPSITTMPNGEVAVAIQAPGSSLYTVEAHPGGAQTAAYAANLGMMAGTSPAITAVGNDAAAAFQANTGKLWTWTGAPGFEGVGAATPNGVATGTSPAIATLSGGEVAVAIQAAGSSLYTVAAHPGGSQTAAYTANVGMMADTSPSITIVGNGNAAAAVQANTRSLWTWTGTTGTPGHAHSEPDGLDSGTSPSITFGPA
jgi:Phage tail lysozyme